MDKYLSATASKPSENCTAISSYYQQPTPMDHPMSPDSDRSSGRGWSAGSAGANGRISATTSTTSATAGRSGVPPLPLQSQSSAPQSPDRGRVRLSHAQASTGRLPVPAGMSPRRSPGKLKGIDGGGLPPGRGPLRPTPPSYPKPEGGSGGSFTARARMTDADMARRSRGFGGSTKGGSMTDRPAQKRRSTAAASGSMTAPAEMKPTVMALQHFSPMDSSKVISVLVLSRMKGLATSVMSACGSDPCIKCVVPDLDATDFDQPGSGSVKAMRDARIAIVDPDLFSPLLRHARHLQWLQCTARDSQTIADQLARVRTEAVRRKMQSQNLIRRLEEHRQRMAEESEEVRLQMEKVEPGLEAARQAILSLNKRSIGELRSFTNPPEMVKNCLGATFRMLASAHAAEPIHGRLGWLEILKITHKQGFIQSVVAFDPAGREEGK